jgi:putative acetyltransferase
MRIRVGGDADAGAAIGVVHHVLFEHGLEFEPRRLDHEILAPDRYFKASGGEFFVAVDDSGRTVGTAGLLIISPGTGELRKLFVLPEMRGLGIGRALLEAVAEAARERGLQRLTLTTRDRYDTAIRLYERFGFRRVGVAAHRRGGDAGQVYAVDLGGVPGRPCLAA